MNDEKIETIEQLRGQLPHSKTDIEQKRLMTELALVMERNRIEMKKTDEKHN